MVAVILAALAGLSYGASDFSGALASKRNDATVVTVVMQVVSLLALLVLVLVVAGELTGVDSAWGALAGLGAAVGLVAYYRALAMGPMSTAAAITALVGSTVPIASGLAMGDRPGTIAMVGVALAVPAAVMVAAGDPSLSQVTLDATPQGRVATHRPRNRTRMLSVVAGVGFGLFFIALSRTGESSGLYPLVGARVASIVALAMLLTVTHNWRGIERRSWPAVAAAGLADCVANVCLVTALDLGNFTWVAAISSLYPVSTVLLARVVLRELLAPVQIAGLALSGGALVLVAAGAGA